MDSINPFDHPYKDRLHLVTSTPELKLQLPVRTAASAVVNASDTCSLSCPDCLFSAALRKKSGVDLPEITMEQAEKFVELMNQARLEQLVFSGGGESFENLPVMIYMLENLKYLKQVVTITSVYFADTPEQTEEILDQLWAAIHRGNQRQNRGNVSWVMRISYDNFHDVPVQNIVNVARYSMSCENSSLMHLVVRTLLDPSENKDIILAELLGGELVPTKDMSDPTIGLPVIDGFPTRWIQVDGESIPIIYKPLYFEGLAWKSKRRSIPGTSWQEVKAFEEDGDSFFNLSLRGSFGEGHNFYQTILKGYQYWFETLRGANMFNTPKFQISKGFSVYMPADGRLIINASAPDSHLPILEVTSWDEYLTLQARDILQYVTITQPTDVLIDLAREVEPEIDNILDRRNFVFALAYTAMETPELRLYIMIRLLQNLAEERGLQFRDNYVNALVSIPLFLLRQLYHEASVGLTEINPRETMSRDPIVGNQPSLYTQ